MQVQTQKQGINQTGLVCDQRVIINEQEFEPLQLIIYATRLEMEGKEVVWIDVNVSSMLFTLLCFMDLFESLNGIFYQKNLAYTRM